MHYQQQESRLALLFLLLLAVMPGCGSGGVSLGTVSGHVIKGGKPVQGITVLLEPVEGGRGAEGVTDANGYYELRFAGDRKGAILGQHNVTVEIKERNSEAGILIKPAEKFLTETREVKSGANTFDFVIK